MRIKIDFENQKSSTSTSTAKINNHNLIIDPNDISAEVSNAHVDTNDASREDQSEEENEDENEDQSVVEEFASDGRAKDKSN